MAEQLAVCTHRCVDLRVVNAHCSVVISFIHEILSSYVLDIKSLFLSSQFLIVKLACCNGV